MGDLEKIFKKLDQIDKKLGGGSSSSSKNSNLTKYFIQGAEALFITKSSFNSGSDPDIFTKVEVDDFGDFGLNKQTIMDLSLEIKTSRNTQMSHGNEMSKLEERLNGEIETKNRSIEKLTDEKLLLEKNLKESNKVILDTLNIDFVNQLPDKGMLFELAVILKSITDDSMPDSYKDEVSQQAKMITTVLHVTYLICTFYDPGKEKNPLNLNEVNALIEHINNKIKFYEIGFYPNQTDEVFDAKKHKTSDNSPFEIVKYITLPIYLKGKIETDPPVKKAIVLTN